MKDDEKPQPDTTSGLSRRDFMKISGIGAAVPLVLGTDGRLRRRRRGRGARAGKGPHRLDGQRQEAHVRNSSRA